MLSVMVHLPQHSKDVFCKIHTVIEISQEIAHMWGG
jgi:hypothetical protein